MVAEERIDVRGGWCKGHGEEFGFCSKASDEWHGLIYVFHVFSYCCEENGWKERVEAGHGISPHERSWWHGLKGKW